MGDALARGPAVDHRRGPPGELRHADPATAGDVEKGMAFGVAAVGSRPQIVVHLPRAKECGSDFDLALLRVAKVIQ